MTSALQDDFKNEMFTVKDQQEIDRPPPPPSHVSVLLFDLAVFVFL